MKAFRSYSADEAWQQLHEAVLGMPRDRIEQRSRAGQTLEMLHVALEIDAPRERWVLSRSPALNPAFAIAEVLWILAGRNDASVLNYWFPRLPEFAGHGPTYPGAYGHRLRTHFGFDQLRRACDALCSDPSSRQVVLQLWDPKVDLPGSDGRSRSEDIPCNVLSLLKVRDHRLDWTQIMRSNDLYRGLPYNLLQFTVLQEIMAGWLGVDVGSYHHWSDSLHVYISDIEHFTCLPIASYPPNTDLLCTGTEVGEDIIQELYSRMVAMTESEVHEVQLGALISVPEAPVGYQNLLLVLGAEAARRGGREDQAAALMATCTNPQLSHAWLQWWRRVRRKTNEARDQVF